MKLTAVLVLLAGVALSAYWLLTPSTPGDESPEAGFARDMQVHHAQAVRMAMVVRDRTTDPEIRTLAYDIATTQQHQIGQMYAWLTLWGLPQAPSGPPMTWMRDHHADTPGEPASMPGMATADQLKALEKASGREAEVLFLRLMIPHHQGGASMAQAALQLTAQREVRLLAQAMLTAQSSEIEVMRRLLTARGDSGLQKTSAAGP
ncbi:DUF305 domain-containing protein [Acrocarpospora macrocephala]|uniref:DUF305 domain-containing protein n=1 Tax=Acrocarpospora macrocephala TaxID=150177 RepID=A0A5M3WNF4_9ACTN|nr:DUF305 domain-containing protein [Acrocarpospora macrocephala]GES08721.1 DUF305 domain-containing protein [Acrocarpospora macrocephala]